MEYRCYCSRERMAAALVSLGRKQLTELAEDPNGIELTCQFCDSRQQFAPEEIRQLLDKASRSLIEQPFCPLCSGGRGLKKIKIKNLKNWVDIRPDFRI